MPHLSSSSEYGARRDVINSARLARARGEVGPGRRGKDDLGGPRSSRSYAPGEARPYKAVDGLFACRNGSAEAADRRKPRLSCFREGVTTRATTVGGWSRAAVQVPVAAARAAIDA